MYYTEGPVPPAPRKRRVIWPFALGAGALGLLILAALCAGVLGAFGTDDPPPLRATPQFTNGVKASAPPLARGPILKAEDLKLTVKTTKKDCFGSAGCNVDYQIRLAVAEGTKLPDSCDVTYQVTGLEDPQTATLTLTSDGKYTQDDWQSGQTKHSNDILKAKVTEVEC
jgi:hypothetical protein